jgi:hypothetical protein
MNGCKCIAKEEAFALNTEDGGQKLMKVVTKTFLVKAFPSLSSAPLSVHLRQNFFPADNKPLLTDHWSVQGEAVKSGPDRAE